MWPALALLLLAGGALSAPTHALVPSDDGPPSVLRTNDAQHPRQHTAISALLPNDHERQTVSFFCKKTRYHYGGRRVGLFGGVWRKGQANPNHGVRFRNRNKGSKWTGWYRPVKVYPANMGAVAMDIPGGNPAMRPDYWLIEMDRMKYTESQARALAREVELVLRSSMQL